MKQYVKIYLCGDCIQYNWKKHKCNLGAHEEGKPSDSFYQDCPLGLHEEDEVLPSAESERKKGEWIFHIDDLFPEESTQECSVCHAEESIKIQNDNFCPNCGADMRGENHE